jgi:hypothetical protein
MIPKLTVMKKSLGSVVSPSTITEGLEPPVISNFEIARSLSVSL